MSNGGDAAEQVIKISLDGVDYAIRIAGAGAKNLIALLMALAKSKKSQPPQLKPSGKERLKRMIKSGSPLDVFPVREQDIRAFTQEAKKYGIVFFFQKIGIFFGRKAFAKLLIDTEFTVLKAAALA